MQKFAYKNRGMSRTKIAEYEPVSSLFKALANPVRAAIVHLLSIREHTVGQLVEDLGLSQPLVSQHLRILRGARMVATRRQGQGVWYSICDQHVAHILGDAMKHTQEGKQANDSVKEEGGSHSSAAPAAAIAATAPAAGTAPAWCRG